MNIRIPVFCYHSVGARNQQVWSNLSVSLGVFQNQLLYLRQQSFNTLSISQVAAYQSGKSSVSPNSVALTFDDGYLDNWVFAYPLLKRYGLKATIFINPAFVDATAGIRPNLENVWSGELRERELKWRGYLSWDEIKAMSDSGVIEIQSHGLTHNWYFCSDKLIDFRHPGDPYYWLPWLLHPEHKPFWLENRSAMDEATYGYPIYEHRSGFVAKRFFNDENLAKRLLEHVRNKGGPEFFKAPSWREELRIVADNYNEQHNLITRKESDKEYLERVVGEALESRKIIEEKTGKVATVLCWPNGAFTEELHSIATGTAGYSATVTTQEFPLKGRYDNLIGRIYFGQHYQKLFCHTIHLLKFISAVETRAGSGKVRALIELFQRLKKIFRNI